MQESLEHLTTSYTPPMAESYTSLWRRLKGRRLLLANEMGKRYGLWTILADPIPLGGVQRLWAKCDHCQRKFLVRLADLSNGKSTQCKGAAHHNPYYASLPRTAVRTLQTRYNRITSATNPNCDNPAYRMYRERGIQNRFPSCEAFVRYVWETMPHPTYKGLEIGRINNLGHYEPGNLRLETREENAQNRECNTVVEFMGQRMSIQKFHREARLRCHATTTRMWIVQRKATVQEVLSRFSTSQTRAPGIDLPLTE